MRRIAHLSDLHFDRVDPGLVDSLLRDLEQQQPHVVAVAGDLTLKGLNREFRAARAFLDRLPAPCVVVPGNHDIPRFDLIERFTDPFAAWRRSIGPTTEPFWHDDQLVVAGLNTVRTLFLHPDWSAGSVSSRQLNRLAERLAELPGRMVVVVAHHPPSHPVGHASRPLNRARLLRAWLGGRKVRALLTGHLHRFRMEQDGPTLLLDAATALSHRLRGQSNGYNLIELDGPETRARARHFVDGAWRDMETVAAPG